MTSKVLRIIFRKKFSEVKRYIEIKFTTVWKTILRAKYWQKSRMNRKEPDINRWHKDYNDWTKKFNRKFQHLTLSSRRKDQWAGR